MPRFLVPLLLASLLAPSSSAFAGDANETWRVKTLERRYSVAAGQNVQLSNPFGELLVRSSGTSEMTVHASVQHHVEDPREPQLDVDHTPQGFKLIVTYPEDAEPPEDAWRKRRVDLTAFVPGTSRLRLETLHDRLRAQGPYPAIEARSESGDIAIRGSGRVQARSQHGKVSLRVLGDGLEPLSLTTVTGEIRLDVPWNAPFLANVETRGEIASDFSIDIAWLPGSQMKRGTVLIKENLVKENEPAIDLRSDRGDIRLLRQMPPPGPS